MAWAREMTANEVMNELQKHGAIADKEWHGDKLERKTYEQRAEEWAANPDRDYEEEQIGQNGSEDIEAGRFEIEVEETKPKRPTPYGTKDSNSFDALQRQRSAANAVF